MKASLISGGTVVLQAELMNFGFQRSSKRFRSRVTFPRTRRRLLSSAIGTQLLESQTPRHVTWLQIFLVLNLTGTGIVRRSMLLPFLLTSNFGNIVPRTREGYYHTTGGIDAAVSRALAFAPCADLIWLETKTPDLKQAQSFARRIHEKFPGKWLVYNLSPSFNWSAHGYSGMYRSQPNLPHSLL